MGQNEHKDKKSKYQPANHLKDNPIHKFKQAIINKAPDKCRKRRVLEAYFIKTISTTLNEELDNDVLYFFGKCITQI